MADYVTIANLALDRLGEDDQLATPDDDTKSARTIKVAWGSLRQALLRAHPWNFAIARASLAALATPPAFEFSAAYNFPPDYVRLVDESGPINGNQDWTIEGRQLLANFDGPAQIRYVWDVEDTELWDPMFTLCFASLLARKIGNRLTGDNALVNQVMQEFKDELNDAKIADAVETPPVIFDEDPWILARVAGGAGYSTGEHEFP